MKKYISLILCLILSASILSACSKSSVNTKDTTTAVTDTTAVTQSETQTEVKSSAVNTTAQTKLDIDSWNINDLVNYFKDEKVFTNNDYLSVYDYIEDLPSGVSAEIEYNNHEDKDSRIEVLIFAFYKDAKDKDVEKAFNKIKNDKYFEWDTGDKLPFNAVIGRFAIFYSSSSDKDFVNKFEASLDKLIKESGVKPDFYDKNIDLSNYKSDEIVVEGND